MIKNFYTILLIFSASIFLFGHGGMTVQELVNSIDLANPDKHLVEDFQRATMNMTLGDPGYGNLGPKTKAKLREIKKNMDSKSIKTDSMSAFVPEVSDSEMSEPVSEAEA